MYKIFTESRKKKLVMRVSFIYIVLLISGIQMLMASNSRGQGLEDIMITVEVNEQNLESLLKNIEGQTGLTFAYLPSEVQQYHVISLTPGKHSVKAVLDTALWNTGLRYRFIENSIIIFPKEENKTSLIATNEVEEVTNPSEYPKKIPDSKESKVDFLTQKDLIEVFKRRLVFSVSGNVVDEQGEPLIGVNILVKGTNKGTATDIDGNFTLEDIDENAVLVVSYVGYQKQEVAVVGKTNLTITLASDSQLLDEVVVVGYGTQKKVNLTGSVSTIGAKEISSVPVANVSTLLAGKLPGLIAVQRSGEPGADAANLSIRGFSNALVVVDGIVGRDFTRLNPNEIESITILKDAASAAVYGVSGGNGVILVTTKEGFIGKPEFNYSVNYGLQTTANYPEFVNSAEYAILHNESAVNLGGNQYIQKKKLKNSGMEQTQIIQILTIMIILSKILHP